MFDWDDLDQEKCVNQDVAAKVELPEPMAEPMAVADIQNSSRQPASECQTFDSDLPATEPMVEPVSECLTKTEMQSSVKHGRAKQDSADGAGDFRQVPPAALTSLYAQFAEKQDAVRKKADVVSPCQQDQASCSGDFRQIPPSAFTSLYGNFVPRETRVDLPSQQDSKSECSTTQHLPEGRCDPGSRDTPTPQGKAVDAHQGFFRCICQKCMTLIYQFVTLLFCKWALFFHAYEIVDLDKLPEAGTGALIVVMHSTHDIDIWTLASMIYAKTGRAPRLLLYGSLCKFLPVLKMLGFACDSLETTVDLLRKGSLTVTAPGGVPEALRGHENAYSLHSDWEGCCSYARMAKEAGVKIYPCFTQNADEMRFNPAFCFANMFWLGKLYDILSRIPVLGMLAERIATFVWFCTMGWPIPVKLTTYFGDPVETDGLKEDEIAKATKAAMASLIGQYQPHGHAYLPGLKRRVCVSFKKLL